MGSPQRHSVRGCPRLCIWRDLPGEFPAWQTVYTYFRNWRQDGTWVMLHDRLRDWVRADNGRPLSPSEAIVDSQSVATATMVHESVGFDKVKHTVMSKTSYDGRYARVRMRECW